MPDPINVLIVEDSETDCRIVAHELKKGGYSIEYERVETKEAFLLALKKGGWDIIISDYSLPKFNGLDAVKLLKESGIDLPFILVSGTIGEEIAVESFLAGVHDFIVKGKWERFIPAIKRELKEARVRSEHMQAEAALRESEERYRSLTETATNAIISAACNGTIISWNKGAQTLFGYSTEEVSGKALTILMPEKYREAHKTAIKRACETGSLKTMGKSIELVGVKKDGTEFPLELSLGYWKKDEEIFYSGIIRDVTERKKTEEALHDKTRLLQLLQEITVTVNEAATAEEAMQICIDKICSFTKWPLGHVYIADSKGVLIPSKIWHIENAEQFKVFLKVTEDTSFDRGVGLPGRVLASGKPYWITDVTKVPWFLRTKSGKDIGLKAGFAFPVLEGKKVVAVLEFFSNKAVEPDESMLEVLSNLAAQVGRVTERKRADEKLKENENQLRQSQKMEAIGTLAGGIAHDFNNMLTGIIGYTEFTMESLNPEDDSYDNLQKALKSSYSARDIVAQLLTFSRKTKEEKEILQLSDLIPDTLKLIGSSLPSNVSVEKLIDKNLPQIMGSEIQMQQILMNLCINAGHAMPGGGTLKITLKSHCFDKFEVLPDQEISGLYIVLSAEDSGIGMDKNVIERIFEPFFTTKEVDKGTGLGLSTVFGIVKQHDGHITVDSKKGIGTIFHVYLPAATKDDETILKTVSREKPSGKKGKSVLFEDKEKVQNRFEVRTSQEEFVINIIGNNPLGKSNEKQLLDYYVLARNDRKKIIINCESNVENHLKNIGFNKFIEIRAKG